MRNTALISRVEDQAPDTDTVTGYDERHFGTYLRLLDAESEGVEWDEAALLVLRIDPIRESARAHRAWETHLARAKWLAAHGYAHLICDGVAN
jgi:hypothetical protein